MPGPESSQVHSGGKERFPKLSRIEFLELLTEADSITPPNTLYPIKTEQLKQLGLPSTEVETGGRITNPIRQAIETSRGGSVFQTILAMERAWEYYNSQVTE